MDCRTFRQQHLAYLDDTLPGDTMSAAQRHILACDGCAAHDTRVRRSLMVARSLPTVELSHDFSARLQARLAECKRDEPANAAELALLGFRDEPGPFVWVRRATALMAVGTMAVGALAFTARETPAPLMSLQPVLAAAPPVQRELTPLMTPPLMQAMATGNPMWPAAILIEDLPGYLLEAAEDGELGEFGELQGFFDDAAADYQPATGFQTVSFLR